MSDLGKERQINLSEIVESISYIKLETNSDALIGRGRNHIRFADQSIVIADEQFLRFNWDGEFQNKISRKGKGPGEFIEFAGFDFDSSSTRIYIFDRIGKILNFNLNGEFLSQASFRSGLHSMILGKNLVWTIFPERLVDLSNGYRLIAYKDNGTIEAKYLHVEQGKENGGRNHLSVQNCKIYSYKDSLTFWDGSCDTIYRVSQHGEILPKYLINLGKKGIPKYLNHPTGDLNYRKIIDGYRMITDIAETQDYMLFTLNDKGIPVRALYSKKNRSVVSNSKILSLVNDIDGGPDFWPDGNGLNGEMYMVSYYFSHNNSSRERTQDLVPSSIVKDLIETTDLNDNPVIMLVKFIN